MTSVAIPATLLTCRSISERTRVLGMILMSIAGDGATCSPDDRTLARLLGEPRKVIPRCLHDLERAKFFRVQPAQVGGPGRVIHVLCRVGPRSLGDVCSNLDTGMDRLD